MNLRPYVFDADYVVKIRSELSITVLEKKKTKLPNKKVNFLFSHYSNRFKTAWKTTCEILENNTGRSETNFDSLALVLLPVNN